MSFLSWPLFIITVILALIGSVVPFPLDWVDWRPEWLGLVVFYWVFRGPERHGVFTAWTLGLLLDVLEGQVLGVNAFAMGTIALLVLATQARIRNFPMPQLTLMVFLLLGLNQMLVHFMRQFLGSGGVGFEYLYAAISGALVWPILCTLLDKLNFFSR